MNYSHGQWSQGSTVKLQRIAIFFIIAISLTAFLIPAVRMPDIPRVAPPTIEMPQPGQGMAVEIGYMIISGLLAGFSPLLFLASLFLGILLFMYNKSRIPQYSRYYIIGAFVIFFTFQYRMTLPGGIESSLFGFQVLMIMGVISMLLALIALEFSPEFAARMARNESVRVTYFIFIGALIALVIVMYGDGATTPAVDFAASTGHGLSELLVYNLCAMVPSTSLFAILSMNRISMRTKLANNRESILLIGTIILVISLLVIEVISLLS
jgi:hypothetical protein